MAFSFETGEQLLSDPKSVFYVENATQIDSPILVTHVYKMSGHSGHFLNLKSTPIQQKVTEVYAGNHVYCDRFLEGTPYRKVVLVYRWSGDEIPEIDPEYFCGARQIQLEIISSALDPVKFLSMVRKESWMTETALVQGAMDFYSFMDQEFPSEILSLVQTRKNMSGIPRSKLLQKMRKMIKDKKDNVEIRANFEKVRRD